MALVSCTWDSAAKKVKLAESRRAPGHYGATGSVGANRTTSRRIPPLKDLSSPFEEPIFSSGPQRDVVTW